MNPIRIEKTPKIIIPIFQTIFYICLMVFVFIGTLKFKGEQAILLNGFVNMSVILSIKAIYMIHKEYQSNLFNIYFRRNMSILCTIAPAITMFTSSLYEYSKWANLLIFYNFILYIIISWLLYLINNFDRKTFYDYFIYTNGLIENDYLYDLEVNLNISILKNNPDLKKISNNIKNDMELNKIISYYTFEIEKNKNNMLEIEDIIRQDYNVKLLEIISSKRESENLKSRYDSFLGK